MSEDDEVVPPGSAIGGYTVRRVLGRGGFGITYEAGNRVTGRNVAIKEFFPSRMARRGAASRLVYSQSDADMVTWALQKFEETTTTLCRLSHPNIVEVIDYVPANNTGYMIMELLDGTTLKDRLRARERAPTLDELRPLVEPVMDALTYVHGQGLVHRDIAPDNILITAGGRPVLIDFGSVSVGRADHGDASSTVGLTKRHYTAPEQMSAKTRPQPAADVYSMGAVVYRALCGIEPVDGLDRVDAMFLRKEADPYRPVAGMAGAGCPNRAATIIDKALDLRPDGRPRSIADLRRGLWPAEAPPVAPPVPGIGAQTGPGTRTGALTWTGPRTWKLAALVLVGVAALAAALVGFTWSNDGRRDRAGSIETQPASPPPAPAPAPTRSTPASEPPLSPGSAPESQAPGVARGKLLQALTEAPDYAGYFDRLKTVFPGEYESILDALATSTQGKRIDIDAVMADAVAKLRHARGTLAAKAPDEALARIFASQLAEMKALAAKDATLCVAFLYGAGSPGFARFAADHRPLVAAAAIAGLDAMVAGRDHGTNRGAPTDADFQALDRALVAKGLTRREIDALLDGKAPEPPIAERTMCAAGQIYLATLAALPPDTRARLYGLAVELMAKS